VLFQRRTCTIKYQNNKKNYFRFDENDHISDEGFELKEDCEDICMCFEEISC
jgi:hypothetical protein